MTKFKTTIIGREVVGEGFQRRKQPILWLDERPPVSALAAGSRRAKTAKPVECEASQSGPKGNAQPHGDISHD